MLEINQKSLTVPLIQGGMGVGVSLGSLAGHVAKCGAMGVISTAHPGYKEDDFESNHRQANIRALKKEILKAQKFSQGKGLVAINAMVALKDYDELINAALESKVDAIISGAGLPLRLPELVKDHDVLIAPIVSSGKACKVIIKHWLKKYQRTPDFIVIEGSQAGGHLGFKKEDLENQTCQSLEEIFKDVEEIVENNNGKIYVTSNEEYTEFKVIFSNKKVKEVFADAEHITAVETKELPEDGVAEVTVTAEKNKDVREEIFHICAESDMPILEMINGGKSLEDIFLELTSKEEE